MYMTEVKIPLEGQWTYRGTSVVNDDDGYPLAARPEDKFKIVKTNETPAGVVYYEVAHLRPSVDNLILNTLVFTSFNGGPPTNLFASDNFAYVFLTYMQQEHDQLYAYSAKVAGLTHPSSQNVEGKSGMFNYGSQFSLSEYDFKLRWHCGRP